MPLIFLILSSIPFSLSEVCNSSFACDSTLESGCCLGESTSRSRLNFSVWIVLLLIGFSYLYLMARFCYKFWKKRAARRPVSFSRCNTQPQELNLMVSFNDSPNRNLERFNFENVPHAHFHVPVMPTTPPPGYVTPTPPPTYNVAIHFPSFFPNSVRNETGGKNQN